MPAVTLKDLLRHGLGEIYDAQRQILPLIDRTETETQLESVRQRLRRHREETLRQIENLHRCFELLGTDAPRVECAVARAFNTDNRQFREQRPDPWAVEAYNLEAVAKVEQFECASYEGLVQLASVLRHDDVRRLLEQNLAVTDLMRRWVAEARLALLDRLGARTGGPAG